MIRTLVIVKLRRASHEKKIGSCSCLSSVKNVGSKSIVLKTLGASNLISTCYFIIKYAESPVTIEENNI